VRFQKKIGHNRVTVSKYLEIMKAHKLIDFEEVAQAKLWTINTKGDKPTILIVDDEPHIVELVSLSLIPEKYNILKAFSGLDALDKVYTRTPDVIILDLMMPGINGYEICQKLKENAITQHIPIIILSAKGEIEDKLRGLKIGADDYITKPFDPMELEARVEAVVRRASQDMDTHPLTKLPGKEGIRENLKKKIINKGNFFVSNIKIQNLEHFNKKFGFRKGEHALTLLSRVFCDSLADYNNYFIGHTLKDNFVLITKDDKIIDKINKSFDRISPYLYQDPDVKDRIKLNIKSINSGEIMSKNLKTNNVLSYLEVN